MNTNTTKAATIWRVSSTVFVQCAELNVSCNYPDGTGHLPVFKVLFFLAVLGSHISGGTFIWPRKEYAGAKRLIDYYELLPIKGTQKIKTGDAGFDQYFRLRSIAAVEAAFLLKADRRHAVLKICQGTQLPLSF